jgi:2-polyprenyl-3-methyl-5-hydroxy-6-metoxy-1,4-benzoquinol methylase
MKNNASSVLFRRMPYYLSPQFDIYEKLGPFVKDQRVLEVGFGTGIGVLQYAEKAEYVFAVEIDPAAVRFAQRCFPLQNVTWAVEDITKADNPAASYDFIVMIEVLEHIEFANLALVNVRALLKLKPESQALITVPNRLRYRKKDDPLIEHEWNASDFYKLLKKHFEFVIFTDHNLRDLSRIPTTTETPLIALCS